ncbi:hypothetical protein [Clostridium tagluense]|uniref:hypothetical protein n=1 Tax=Clostridium tagluense TaxID=360422 RepID=UPI001C6E8574|nr:hypothetical protein [Clostridium tagluense]MBW9159117.1 hypothetical protein [Clostridium tagluense]WLC68232.1 hypothetical protein KTC93_24075 [Clostridium tagluense]
MSIFKITVIVVVIYVVIALIFRYFITIKKLKISKLSRLFYDDDENFIKSWKKMKDKGVLRYILKNIVIGIATMGIISIFFLLNKFTMYGYEQRQTLFVALFIGIIFGLINSLTQYIIGQDRYRQLKVK